MCTDVDRNDKARICKAGSVRVEGRRMIELYSKLIHTVDYVTGELKDECDGFDALLSHMWAVTLTGAPKPAAMQQIEALENSARRWYGGCVGMLRFNGQVNTGITIRTVHLEEGQAQVRVGATVLCDSIPEEEERETRTKAEAFINAVLGVPAEQRDEGGSIAHTGRGKKVLFVDNRDSFVHAGRLCPADGGRYHYGARRFPAQRIRRGGSGPGLCLARSGVRPRNLACPIWCASACDASCPCLAYAQAYRAWWRRLAVSSACCRIPCTGSPLQSAAE